MSVLLAVEYAGKKFIMPLGILVNNPFPLGELLLGMEAYIVSDSQDLQVLAHLPIFVVFLILFYLPQSPCWLLASGEGKEDEKVIIRVARWNKNEALEHLIKQASLQVVVRPKICSLSFLLIWWDGCTGRHHDVPVVQRGHVLLRPVLRLHEPNRRRLPELLDQCRPGHLFCLGLIRRIGRRPMLAICQVLTGVACLSCGILQLREFQRPQLYS